VLLGQRPRQNLPHPEKVLTNNSNAVQLITSILLLRNGQIAVLQTTLIGSILSSMHLMLGLAFCVGGYNRLQQHFNTELARGP